MASFSILSQAEVDECRQDAILNEIPEAKKCNYRDVIDVSPETMKDQFDTKVWTESFERPIDRLIGPWMNWLIDWLMNALLDR